MNNCEYYTSENGSEGIDGTYYHRVHRNARIEEEAFKVGIYSTLVRGGILGVK